MQNSHNYTSLKRLCEVSLKCIELNPFCEYFQTVNNGCYGCCYVEIQLEVLRFLNLNVTSGVISGKSFQNTIYKWTGMLMSEASGPSGEWWGQQLQG